MCERCVQEATIGRLLAAASVLGLLVGLLVRSFRSLLLSRFEIAHDSLDEIDFVLEA